MTRVADVMTRGVRTMRPHDTTLLAAQAMKELDIGSIPICEGDKVVGVVTDRDLVIRALAETLPIDSTPLKDVMTPQVECVYEDDDLNEVIEKMQQSQIRRLPVLDREERISGMLTLGDLATKGGQDEAGEALATISDPARPARGGLSAASGSAGGGETF